MNTRERPDNEKGQTVINRRNILAAAVALTTGILVKSLPGETVEPRECNNEVLVNPDKFESYVNDFYKLSKKLSRKKNRPIPYEVFLAVSMHESDSGTSELAEEANNYFGVIAKDGWDGDVYYKVTEEEVPAGDIEKYGGQEGFELLEAADTPDGRSRIRYERPFRKYASPAESFNDFAEKIYFKEKNGNYRYADVVEYLQNEGRDPYKVVELMSDSNEPGELRYATGSEWKEAVNRYIQLVQERTDDRSAGRTPVEDVELPPEIEAINLEELDFSDFREPRENKLKSIMLEAFGSISGGRWEEYRKSGILKKAEMVRELTDIEYYQDAYGLGSSIKPSYIVWHLWANGVNSSGDKNTWPKGSSNQASLEDQIKSWYGRRDNAPASCGYLMGLNGETWQLVQEMFDKTWHVATGIQDGKARTTHPGVNNQNAIGIEVQADSIGSVSVEQFEKIIYWTALTLLESALVKEGMTREEVNAAVESSVVGHGKVEGLEFGSKYTRPMIQTLQQFMFMAI